MKDWFGHIRASAVSSDTVRAYIEKRQEVGASNATINRELAALKRMFSLGMKTTPPKVYRVPAIPKLKENNARRGFVTEEKYLKLANACASVGLYLRAMLEVGYIFGWRVSELKKLRVRQIDLVECRIVLDPGSTKNMDGRSVKFKPDSTLAALLTECCKGKKFNDHVFTREDGTSIQDFRGVWARVCREAGLGTTVCRLCETEVDEKFVCPTCKVKRNYKQLKTTGLLFHDLRRSAARNARASGVPESVVMKMGGWRTSEVFRRYAIVADSDMGDAINLIEARRAQFGHSQPKLEPSQSSDEQGKMAISSAAPTI